MTGTSGAEESDDAGLRVDPRSRQVVWRFSFLDLRWHYRSRHESLIAFSNTLFYEGQLVTFPGADHEGPDVGVALIPVEGVYRRGSSRDNPIEARTVAELVIHHYDTRPGKSVGVVTFSVSQASTIEAVVEELRAIGRTWTSSSPRAAWTASSSRASNPCRATSVTS